MGTFFDVLKILIFLVLAALAAYVVLGTMWAIARTLISEILRWRVIKLARPHILKHYGDEINLPDLEINATLRNPGGSGSWWYIYFRSPKALREPGWFYLSLFGGRAQLSGGGTFWPDPA